MIHRRDFLKKGAICTGAAALSSQVAAATEEQGTVVEHINQSAHEISGSATEIHNNAQQQQLGTQSLLSRAQHLKGLVSQFRV